MAISQMAAWTALAFFPGAMVLAAITDLTTMTIRNRLVLVLIAGFIVLAPLAGFTLYDMALNLGLAGAVFVVGFTLFSMGWIGGGDAKLAAATVLWLGPAGVLAYLVYTGLIGGILALAIVAFRQVELPAGWRSAAWLQQLHAPHTGVPYGAAMAPAALLVFPHTSWMQPLL